MAEIRESIDAIDDQVLSLLNQRAEAVLEVGAWKQARGQAVLDPSRENRIVERLLRLNRGPLDAESLESLYRVLIASFRAFEERAGQHRAATANELTRGEDKHLRLKRPTLTVIGCGLMGGSFVKAARRTLIDTYNLRVHDPRFSAADTFVGEGVQVCGLSDALTSDVLLLAMPVNAIIEFLRENGRAIRGGAVVFDFGSTKRLICEAAEEHCHPSVTFVGGHPLCGKEASGFESSDADLFQGKAFVLTPTRLSDDRAVTIVSEMMSAVGAWVLKMSAESHDRHLAFVSHLPQIVATALCLTAAEVWNDAGSGGHRPPPLIAPSLLEMTRLGASSGTVWRDIVMSNADHLGQAIERMKERLNTLQQRLAKGDIHDLFTAANAVRSSISTSNQPLSQESLDDHNHEKQPHGRSVA